MTSSETSAPSRRRLRLAVVPGVVLALAAAVTVGSSLVRRALGQGPWPVFLDPMQITHTAGCAGPIVAGGTACDPLGRAYNYPPAWAWAFRLLGLGAESTTWVGVALVGMMVLALGAGVVALRRRLSVGALAAVVAVLVSPPMLLLIGRGNTDLLVCTVVVVVVAITCTTQRVLVPAVLLGLVTGLKLFPIGALAGIRSTRARLVTAAAMVIGIAVISLPWLGSIYSRTPSLMVSSFGVGVLPAIARGGLDELVTLTDQLIGAGLLVVLTGVLLAVRRVRAVVRPLADQLSAERCGPIALTGLGLFAATYVLTTSFDYRMWVLCFVVVGVLVLPRMPSTVVARRLLVGSALSCAWLSHPLRGFEWVGDVVAVGFGALVCACLVLVVVPAGLRGRPVGRGRHGVDLSSRG